MFDMILNPFLCWYFVSLFESQSLNLDYFSWIETEFEYG